MKVNKVFSKITAILFVLVLLLGLYKNGIIGRTISNKLNGATVTDLVRNSESDIAENFYSKKTFVSINGFIARLMGQRTMNGVVRLNNGHGTVPMGECSNKVLKNNARKIKGFSDYCVDQGRTFTYVQVPYKNQEGNDQLPNGLYDYSNDVANTFGKYVKEYGVDYLDIRDTFSASEKDFYSYFYKTEHHWNSYGGFAAFRDIVSYMEENYGDKVNHDMLHIDNYTCDVLPKRHQGYYASKTGEYFIGAEDYYVLYPSFKTSQTCSVPHRDLIRSGNFYDAVLEQSYMNDETVLGLYHTYIGGDYPLVIHHSDTAETKKTVLMFIDSFGIIPESFLTTVYSDVIAVDLRWVLRNNWTETVADFIEQYNPDHVIVMFNPDQLVYEKSVQFEYGIE